MANATAPSMNAMVDTITDAVETAIARSNAPSGHPRFMLQSAVRRALRDINERHTPLRRSNGVRTADSARRSSPRTPSLQFAPGTGPTHGAAMFVRRLGAPPSLLPRPPTPHPSALPRPSPSMTMMLPPVPSAVAAPWTEGGGTMAGRRGTPLASNSNAGAEAWPPGFAYDLDVVRPPPPRCLVAPPTPTRRLIGRAGAPFRRERLLVPDSLLPRPRGRRLRTSECHRNGRRGRIRRAPARSDGSMDRSSPGTSGLAPPAGLHGRVLCSP